MQTGDRSAFLAEARRRLAGGVAVNPVHVPPAPTSEVPEVRFTGLDRSDLAASFERAAREVDAAVHRATGGDVGALVVELAAGATRVVRTPEPEVDAAASALAEAGLTVDPYTPVAGADADVGLTGAVAAVAATGSVVLDASVGGSRGAGLLPPVHLCLVPEDRLVATPAEVLHPLAAGPPSSLVLVSGPSRTGDVEQILTLGVHGPRHLHVVLLRSPS
jgi:L-lactate dehydrogenase complex protein LldG